MARPRKYRPAKRTKPKKEKVDKPVKLKPWEEEGYHSKEEWYFSWYLDELQAAGLISHYEKNERAYPLSEETVLTYYSKSVIDRKTKQPVEKPTPLLKGHVYTPDFLVYPTGPSKLFHPLDYLRYSLYSVQGRSCIYYDDKGCIIETKGDFDSNNMTRLFGLNQKWFYQMHGRYVQLLKIPQLFEKTFTPVRYLRTDTQVKFRKLKYKPKLLDIYLNE